MLLKKSRKYVDNYLIQPKYILVSNFVITVKMKIEKRQVGRKKR